MGNDDDILDLCIIEIILQYSHSCRVQFGLGDLDLSGMPHPIRPEYAKNDEEKKGKVILANRSAEQKVGIVASMDRSSLPFCAMRSLVMEVRPTQYTEWFSVGIASVDAPRTFDPSWNADTQLKRQDRVRNGGYGFFFDLITQEMGVCVGNINQIEKVSLKSLGVKVNAQSIVHLYLDAHTDETRTYQELRVQVGNNNIAKEMKLDLSRCHHRHWVYQIIVVVPPKSAVILLQ